MFRLQWSERASETHVINNVYDLLFSHSVLDFILHTGFILTLLLPCVSQEYILSLEADLMCPEDSAASNPVTIQSCI